MGERGTGAEETAKDSKAGVSLRRRTMLNLCK